MKTTILLIVVLLILVVGQAVHHEPAPHITINNITYISYQPEELVKTVFGNEWPLAWAVVMAESHGNPNKVGDEDLTYIEDGAVYGDSIGLFQIRTFSDRPPRELLLDPYVNVNYAYKLRQKRGWDQWSAYTNGSYRKFLPVLRDKPKKRRYVDEHQSKQRVAQEA